MYRKKIPLGILVALFSASISVALTLFIAWGTRVQSEQKKSKNLRGHLLLALSVLSLRLQLH